MSTVLSYPGRAAVRIAAVGMLVVLAMSGCVDTGFEDELAERRSDANDLLHCLGLFPGAINEKKSELPGTEFWSFRSLFILSDVVTAEVVDSNLHGWFAKGCDVKSPPRPSGAHLDGSCEWTGWADHFYLYLALDDEERERAYPSYRCRPSGRYLYFDVGWHVPRKYTHLD